MNVECYHDRRDGFVSFAEYLVQISRLLVQLEVSFLVSIFMIVKSRQFCQSCSGVVLDVDSSF